MDSLTSCCTNRFFLPYNRKTTPRKLNFLVYASSSKNDDKKPKLDHWDQMELKFGRMIGEDPKLTLAKVIGKKSNPEISYLEIEKSFSRKKKVDDEIVQVVNLPFDKKSNSSVSNLNLVRPVPKKGVKFEQHIVSDNKVNPLLERRRKKVVENFMTETSSSSSVSDIPPPNVMLRKPTTSQEDTFDNVKGLRMKIKPNLVLEMRKDDNDNAKEDNFSELLRKPEAAVVNTTDHDNEHEKKNSADLTGLSSGGFENADDFNNLRKPEAAVFNTTDDDNEHEKKNSADFNSLRKPKAAVVSTTDDDNEHAKKNSADLTRLSSGGFENSDDFNSLSSVDYNSILQKPNHAPFAKPLERSDVVLSVMDDVTAVKQPSDTNSSNSAIESTVEAALQGKPQRLNPSAKQSSVSLKEETNRVSDNIFSVSVDIGDFIAAAPVKDQEDADWTRAGNLLKTEEREEVELISCSTRGFVASFGSLVGFLPYRNLGSKWKFLTFESWLRKKGLDLSMYKQNASIIGGYEAQTKSLPLDTNPSPATVGKFGGELSQDMRVEDLLEIYDQEKIKFLSSFIGQRTKVNVLMADRNSRKLMFSIRPKEREESVEKKRNLMAKLSVGDVVKCCIKKITYFGIFVEVEGVPALIHQSEVSWDATVNPSAFFKLGQIIDAKVLQLDYALERISLSLKEIAPDPLIEALEFVVGDRNSLDGNNEAVQADDEWPEVESIIGELQQIAGVQSVSKGRFFLSPGLAPTFQVYMASMFENQYKLLARSGNKVQEVMVQASLDKEQMKAVILTCTNKVE
ncbi:hypothetical protein C5167_049827 [Papaver somniferum]|uniref:S1 motif domain-containing protein n=1 Tax=Papaver somniferum TaxID=3469 RepID=A0A4Y7KPT0_PAPSO|nr:uncharacterized protein LOC113302344 [Papaver somniferum]RZC74350.1 hypothetical protein C5167_049827 [Papaver somniferum]